jgi:hypothetical protein
MMYVMMPVEAPFVVFSTPVVPPLLSHLFKVSFTIAPIKVVSWVGSLISPPVSLFPFPFVLRILLPLLPVWSHSIAARVSLPLPLLCGSGLAVTPSIIVRIPVNTPMPIRTDSFAVGLGQLVRVSHVFTHALSNAGCLCRNAKAEKSSKYSGDGFHSGQSMADFSSVSLLWYLSFRLHVIYETGNVGKVRTMGSH